VEGIFITNSLKTVYFETLVDGNEIPNKSSKNTQSENLHDWKSFPFL